MKVIHIAFSDTSGGASIAAYRLHKAMKLYGINSQMLVLHKGHHDNDIKRINTHRNFIKTLFSIIIFKIKRLLKINRLYKSIGEFSKNDDGFDISKDILLLKTDFIYFHWINNNMLSLKDIENVLKLNKTTFWFMHDMWPITGGCHHSFNCNKYQSHCGTCPNLYSNKVKDESFKVFEEKISRYKRYKNLHIITPSRWLAQCSRNSYLFKDHPTFIIPNMVDTNMFKPINKDFARKTLNIQSNKSLILFGAICGTGNQYKGWNYLKEALYLLDKEKYEVIIFGNTPAEEYLCEIPFKTYTIGKLNDIYSLVLTYNAADVFIIPSLAENFPQTVLESMSCGIPTVGFNIGGIPEVISHKGNGYIAKYKDKKDLAYGIQWILQDKQLYEKLSQASRNKIIEEYSTFNIVQQHINLLSRYYNQTIK